MIVLGNMLAFILLILFKLHRSRKQVDSPSRETMNIPEIQNRARHLQELPSLCWSQNPSWCWQIVTGTSVRVHPTPTSYKLWLVAGSSWRMHNTKKGASCGHSCSNVKKNRIHFMYPPWASIHSLRSLSKMHVFVNSEADLDPLPKGIVQLSGSCYLPSYLLW